MKTTYLVASASRRGGGVFESVTRLSVECGALGLDRSVVGLADEYSENDRARWGNVEVRLSAVVGPVRFGFSPGLVKELLLQDADVVHVHGLWMYTSVACWRWGAKTCRPYVVSPHGMLEGWALKNRGFGKRVAGLLYERRMLQGASAIHALNKKEADDIRAYGIKKPIAIVPNGVDIPAVPVNRDVTWVKSLSGGRKIFLFLGRIHPKKNLYNLVQAWAATIKQGMPPPQWCLVIAGWDQDGYETQLKELCRQVGVQQSVIFAGPRFGVEKAELFGAASAFVLPSLSEGQPIALLEALANGVPAVATAKCNVPEAFSEGSAIEVGDTVESISRGLRSIMVAGSDHLATMSACGRALAAREFGWRQTAERMKNIYSWVAGGGARPDTVVSF